LRRDGRDEFSVQFGFDAGDAGFLQKDPAGGVGTPTGKFWANCNGRMVLLGFWWVPFIHLLSAQLYIYLQSVQAYISPPIAACFVLDFVPRLNGQGAISSLLVGFVLGASRFVFEVLDKKAPIQVRRDSLAG